MGLVSKNIPNLINGVSQQPAALRLESQGEVQENGFSDVVDGLKKRPPTKYKRKLLDTNGDVVQNLDTAFFHTYKRSDEEQYQVVITAKDVTENDVTTTVKTIYVYDINGVLQYESGAGNTDNTDYLPDNPLDITATSVADATFIVNKKQKVEMSDIKYPPKSGNSALVYLKSVNYGRDYTLALRALDPSSNKTLSASAATINSVTGTQGNNNDDVLKVSTVINDLRNTLLTSSNANNNSASSTVQATHNVPAASQTNYEEPYEFEVPDDIRRFTVPQAMIDVLVTDRFVVTTGGNVIPHDDDGSHGWRWYVDIDGDVEGMEIPSSYITRTYDETDDDWDHTFHRPQITVNMLNAGVELDVVLAPASYGEEPYFIINSPDEGLLKDFSIVATDDDGGVNLKAFKGTAKSFTDLPNQCINNYRLGVVGDNQKKEDDFHVVFEGDAGSGFWRETVAGGLHNDFDLNTMPHTLRQLDDGSFKFGIAQDNDGNNWAGRKAGDNNTNPFPSFVGQTINDIFFHRNRLGVLAGENVIFSEAGGYLNFWRTTVRTLLDSDPIDVSVSQNEVAELKAAVPIQDNLLLFSDLNQFTLSASQLLTPAEVTIDQSTKYECDLTATPVGAGTSVFFATNSGAFSGIREFFTKTDTDIKDAPEITSHVPKYIKGQITDIKVSSNEDILIALTDHDKTECFVYKWYNSSEERLQSSWSKWKFDKSIASTYFNNAELYFTFEDGSYEKMDLAQIDNPVFLDHQIEITNSLTDEELAIVDNINYTSNTKAITEEGYDLGIYNAANQAVIDYLAQGKKIIVGEPYTFKYQMSEQVFKPVQGDSTKMARFQLRKMAFNFSNTGKFDVTVESLGRDPSVKSFTGRILGEPDNVLGQAAIVPEGTFSVGVQSKPQTTKITITNDTHLPCVFQSAEWEGYIVLRNQRL